ncbi:MAG: hypothetical protein KJ630_23745 [Proteobacteria bacterium]|nr:hypothetical protein [Pseudomonadota bacterium]
MHKIACFISPHGFGHATRIIAILEALQGLLPDLHPHIFTSVPQQLFSETLAVFTYHQVVVDIGLAQTSALATDFPATIKKLDDFLPYPETLVERLVALCTGCSLVLCDIAPLGIVVAKRLKIPSVLVENFTWDWIYAPATKRHPDIEKHATLLKNINRMVTHRIQTEPLCHEGPRDFLCGPIFRRSRETQVEVRKRLECGKKKVILITMGGVPESLPKMKLPEKAPDLLLVFTGQKQSIRLNDNILLLNSNSDMYHPDLVGAADLVVCKTGYSTLAECCQVGARVISVSRENFPESEPLQAYLEKVLGGIAITPETYATGGWLTMAAERISRPRPTPCRENGADRIAKFLSKLL